MSKKRLRGENCSPPLDWGYKNRLDVRHTWLQKDFVPHGHNGKYMLLSGLGSIHSSKFNILCWFRLSFSRVQWMQLSFAGNIDEVQCKLSKDSLTFRAVGNGEEIEEVIDTEGRCLFCQPPSFCAIEEIREGWMDEGTKGLWIQMDNWVKRPLHCIHFEAMIDGCSGWGKGKGM